MSTPWTEVAECWHVTLDEFLGTNEVEKGGKFDPFKKLLWYYHQVPLADFEPVALEGHSGLTASLLSFGIPEIDDSVVLLKSGERVGFVSRSNYNSDTLSMSEDLRGKGLAAPFILATMKLRAARRTGAVEDVVKASRSLANGFSFNEAGRRSAVSAYKTAIAAAIGNGRAVSSRVLSSYHAF